MADSSLQVVPVRSRAEKRQFLNLPWQLHREDPNWIPPLRQNQAELVGFKKHPFHDDALLQAFVARRGSKVVGRVAAIIDQAHNRYYDEKRGFFGFFESEDDSEIAKELFDEIIADQADDKTRFRTYGHGPDTRVRATYGWWPRTPSVRLS